jgi:hypothetical protein
MGSASFTEVTGARTSATSPYNGSISAGAIVTGTNTNIDIVIPAGMQIIIFGSWDCTGTAQPLSQYIYMNGGIQVSF